MIKAMPDDVHLSWTLELKEYNSKPIMLTGLEQYISEPPEQSKVNEVGDRLRDVLPEDSNVNKHFA